MKRLLLSYCITDTTPLYGGKRPNISKLAAIENGDSVNETLLNSTVHIGTHIDLPYHFYNSGQTITDYPLDFWFFKKVLFVEITPSLTIIEKELTNLLDQIDDIGYELLIVKTGMCTLRDQDVYWKKGYGFSPNLYSYLKKKFPSIRVFGFDLISITSYLERAIGKEAHKAFLNPDKPILIIEDMDLTRIDESTAIDSILVSPLFIDKCDGLPCTIYATI